MTNTFYNVKAKDGKEFNCVVNGGNVLTAGMINGPFCGKKGEQIKVPMRQ